MQDFNTKNYTISLWGQDRGTFEHNTLGEDSAGGLWFDGDNLEDYDGVYELPKEVKQWLLENEYTHLDYHGDCQLEEEE
jgi:hypothetical protein